MGNCNYNEKEIKDILPITGLTEEETKRQYGYKHDWQMMFWDTERPDGTHDGSNTAEFMCDCGQIKVVKIKRE